MIITSVKFQNFYSFKNQAQMNFLVNENAPSTNHFGSRSEGERFSKVSSIFGANASGKTNAILVFKFLRWFVSDSFSYTRESFSGYCPFGMAKKTSSYFEVEFYVEQIFYKLSLEINSKRILSEVLESRKNKRLTTLYLRKYVETSDLYQFEARNIGLEDSFIEKVRPNASVISTGRQYNNTILTQLREHWAGIFIKSRSGPMFENDFFLFDFHDTSRFYSENEKYFSQTKDFLKKSDLGLSDVKIETEEREGSRGNKKTRFYPYGIHQSKNKKFEIPFFFESGGTAHLYEMLSFIFPALEKGSVCLIDEIENNLHPNILPTIVNLFASEETNPKGAQLICTTHMPTLMADLSKYQIFIVEKNQDCESEMYRLDEIQGVRNDDNLLKKYLAGAYGGIPDVDV